jgi:hypothetical protein
MVIDGIIEEENNIGMTDGYDKSDIPRWRPVRFRIREVLKQSYARNRGLAKCSTELGAIVTVPDLHELKPDTKNFIPLYCACKIK